MIINNMITKRKKKWLGAVIGGVASIASSLINARNQANMQEQALKQQEEAQNKQLAMQNAANLTAKYADTSYIDAMQDKISFKAGGKTKDRVDIAKRFACGGRKKKSLGGFTANPNNIITSDNNLLNMSNSRSMARMGAKYKRKCSK